MSIIGYEVDFGHVEAVTLISSNKISEKQAVGLRFTYIYEIIGLSCMCLMGIFSQ